MTLKQKIIQWIIVAVIASVVGMSAGGIKEIFGKANEAAPVEYVDSKFIEAKDYTDDENKEQDDKNTKEHDDMKADMKDKVDKEILDILHKDIIFIKNWIISKGK